MKGVTSEITLSEGYKNLHHGAENQCPHGYNKKSDLDLILWQVIMRKNPYK